MKHLRNIVLLCLALSLLVPTGCGTFKNMNQTGKNSIVGGAAGGAVGAGIGALIGGGKGTWIGALVGSAIGAGAGAAIGHSMDKQKAELENELDKLKAEINAKDSAIQVKEVTDNNNLKAIKVTLGDAVLFATNSFTLTPAADAALSRIAFNLNQNPGTHITVVGYTDNTGTYDYNMTLSQKRADAVRNYLISQGVAADRIQAVGDGENNPITSNATAAGRTQNRRVELYIFASEQTSRKCGNCK